MVGGDRAADCCVRCEAIQSEPGEAQLLAGIKVLEPNSLGLPLVLFRVDDRLILFGYLNGRSCTPEPIAWLTSMATSG